MANEPLMSNPVDPLHAFSGISLFPRTIGASTDAALPSDSKDLDTTHHFMKSLKMSSPERVLDEAKAIANGASELLNSEFAKFAESIGIDKDVVAPEGRENPQERRPGLCRKRARFSLKPNNSQPPVTLEPSLDIDQLHDPEEFYSAFEKLENAKREIQKQTGGTASDLNEHNASTNTRHRRPGILGKSASYKHQYSSVLSESDDMLTSSQETLQQAVQDASSQESQKETNVADVEIEDTDGVGSTTNAENGVNEILDELLSRDGKDLNEDGALSLLWERLQIKPIDLGNLSIPEFQGIGSTDFKTLGERLPEARKYVSNMSNLVKQLSRETPQKYKEAAENAINPIASPTPLLSPFPSLSLFKMRTLQPNQLRDPLSPLNINIDVVEQRNPFSAEDIGKQSDMVGVFKDMSMYEKSRSEMEDETNRPSGPSMHIHIAESRGPDSSIDGSLDKYLDGQIRDKDTRPNGSQMDLQDQFSGNEIRRKTMDSDTARGMETIGLTKAPDELAENIEDMSKGSLTSGERHLNADDSAKSGSSLDVHLHHSSQVNGMLSEEAVPAEEEVSIHLNADDSAKSGSSLDVHLYHSSQVNDMLSEEAVPAEEEVSIQNSTNVQNMSQNQLHSDELTSTASEEDAADMPSRTVEISPAKITETHLSQKQQCKAKRPRVGNRESKLLVLRPSLAAAGTSFEFGVRRSRRIRMRPLEYWKGERFLYGRIDKSLKLLGVKYASPSKDDGSLTVKSYVPDDYKEILQLAAHY